jgi:hypothetical protein
MEKSAQPSARELNRPSTHEQSKPILYYHLYTD